MPKTHGMSMTPTYRSWACMMKRCYRTSEENYPRYGGKGIGVCKRWHMFENFLDDMGERPQGHTIDRIKNHIGYEPDNCRWSTQQMQRANSSLNVKFINITISGETRNLYQWCKILGLKYNTIYVRIRRGWLPLKALEQNDD